MEVSIFNRVVEWMRKLVDGNAFDKKTIKHQPISDISQVDTVDAQVVPYDEELLEKCRTQWQFGDWETLSALPFEKIRLHPDRAQIALLAAAGLLQKGEKETARKYLRMAKKWGCSKQLMSRVLISGVYNTLGKTSILSGEYVKGFEFFEKSISCGMPTSEKKLITQARIEFETNKYGLKNGLDFDNKLKFIPPQADKPYKPIPAYINQLVEECLKHEDIHQAIDEIIASNQFQNHEKFMFYLGVSDHFRLQKDNLTAIHFLMTAKEFSNSLEEQFHQLLVPRSIALGRAELVADMIMNKAIKSQIHIHEKDKRIISEAYKKTVAVAKDKSEHGHAVLLSYIKDHLNEIKLELSNRKPVLIEIGTTRENVPGQGSTRKIMEFCKTHDMKFITVDMDPHNTRMADELFNQHDGDFEAVNMKGEDFLETYSDPMDFIFLDAYDFDHGNHSELRQSRYKKYLGSEIDEQICHQMHLSCAESVEKKLSANGVVCIDDTWLDNGDWMAKGTLAVPFLLDAGFKLLEVRNRAALLGRSIS